MPNYPSPFYIIRMVPILLFSLLLNACNALENETAKNAPPPIAPADGKMITTSYQDLMLTVKLAGEAVNRSTAQDTKELAQIILQEHKQMMNDLEVVAGKHQLELPLDISAEQTKHWQMLVRERGIAFDKAYAEVVQKNHERQIDAFAEIKRTAANADLKSVAEKFLAVADRHMQHAVTLKSALDNRRSRDTALAIEISQEP
jgi:predicted outer membrane protein